MVVEMSPMMLINFSVIGAFQMIPVFLLILLQQNKEAERDNGLSTTIGLDSGQVLDRK